MSRISKDLASQIAYKLTDKSRKVADVLKKQYEILVTELYEAQVPQEVKDTFAKHPDWFYTRQRVNYSGHGFNWEQVYTTKPVICNVNGEAHLKLNDKISDKITKAKRKWEKALEDTNKLKDETETALLNLKTYNQIREQIPLAAQFLPPPLSNALVVNYDDLQRKLDKQPELSKATV